MRFGDEVVLRRGGHHGVADGDNRGCYRDVRARYIGARGSRVRCELLEDDSLSVAGPWSAGERGWWSRSVMRRSPCST